MLYKQNMTISNIMYRPHKTQISSRKDIVMDQILAFIFEQIANILYSTADYYESEMFKQVADFFAGINS